MRQGKHRPHYATARSRRSLRRRREVGLPGMIATLLLALAALLPNVVLAIMVGQMAGSVAYFLAQLLMGVVLLLVPLLFLPARGWLLLEGVFLLVYPMELVSLLSIGEPLNYAVFSSVLHTTPGEAIGQLRAYALPAIGYLVALVVYFTLLLRAVPRGWWLKGRVRLIGIPVLVLAALVAPLLIIPKRAVGQSWSYYLGQQYHPALKRLFNGSFPFDVLRHAIAYRKATAATERVLAQRGEPVLGGLHRESDSTQIVGVLVIGETSRACNWQLAGYERATNPRLAARSGLYFYPNAYTGADYTILAVPMLVSNSTPVDCNGWQRSPLLSEVGRQAGIRTGWVTLQSVQNPWCIVSMQACNYRQVVESSSPVAPIPLDGCLLPKALDFLRDAKGSSMLVLHTYGGHFYYPDRYPAVSAFFTPELPRGGKGESAPTVADRERIVNSFDNTIVYTDSVLDALIGFLESQGQPAFLIYAADHGENLYDDAANPSLFHASAHPTHYEAHVPLLVWLSSLYRARFPTVDSLMAAHRELPVQTTSVYHTFLRLMGLRYDGERRNRALCDSLFTPLSSRMLLNAAGELQEEPSIPASCLRWRDSVVRDSVDLGAMR